MPTRTACARSGACPYGYFPDAGSGVGGKWHAFYLGGEAIKAGQLAAPFEVVHIDAHANAEFPESFPTPRPSPQEAGAYALLMTMPAPDFFLAVEEVLERARRAEDAAPRITKICRSRGAPWVFTAGKGFEWVGDDLVEHEVMRPIQSVLNDPAFAGGVRTHFETARKELRLGTPTARKQAVHEAACAVEAAMKVMLDKHGIAYDAAKDTAQPLFDRLEAADIVPRYMEKVVLGAVQPRNKVAGHDAVTPHNVPSDQAEAVVASAAGAIVYLSKQ